MRLYYVHMPTVAAFTAQGVYGIQLMYMRRCKLLYHLSSTAAELRAMTWLGHNNNDVLRKLDLKHALVCLPVLDSTMIYLT